MKFGLKRAAKAAFYTKTEEGRRAVLGVLEIFGIKNTVLAEANNKCRKLIIDTAISEKKIGILTKKTTVEKVKVNANNLETESIHDLVKEWVL